jgi:signal transduction histidine kinase
VVSGLVAAWRRPASRVGLLLVAAGIGLLLRRLQYSNDALLFTIGFALGEVSSAFIAHAVLGYPTGRLRALSEKAFVYAGYAIGLALPLLTLLFFDSNASCFYNCDGAHAHSLIGFFPSEDAANGTRTAFRVLAFGVLGGIFILLVVRKLLVAGAAGRRMLAPLLIASLAAASRAVSEAVIGVSDHSESTRVALFWWQMAVLAAIPLSLLIGLLRSRLARVAVADMLPRLDNAEPADLGPLLAKALRDPTVELAFWYPQDGSWVDADGAPVQLPVEGSGRSVAHIEHDGPIAALIHDSMLVHEPHLVRDVAAAARLALENARLQAEMRAQLTIVQESRARIVKATDEERRRIERDLHDGAQQRLVALALQLRTAHRNRGERVEPEVAELLTAAVGELQVAVAELRELAQGVHPAILTEEGLNAALESLVGRTPLLSTLDADEDRFAPNVEATAYFVVSEALTNVVKHAQASRVAVSARRRAGVLVVQVVDNGIGGAQADGGSGLRGLADRVEAAGGRLLVECPAEGGTCVVAEIPCES